MLFYHIKYLMRFVFFIFVLFFFAPCYALPDIISADYSSVYKSLVIIAETKGNKTVILKTSLTECRDTERLIINGKISSASLSKYVPTYLIAGEDRSIALYNTLSGKVAWKWDGSFSAPIKKISQDFTGEFIAATDGVSVALFRFKKNGLEQIFTKEFSGAVSAVLPDGTEKVCLIAERHGIITAWSISGALLSRINVTAPINDMIGDSRNNGFLIVGGDGIYFMSGDRLQVSRLLPVKADSIGLDALSGRLAVMAGASAYIYDYSLLKRLFIIGNGFGKIADSGGAGFLGLFIKNSIRLFDAKTGLQTATINVTEKGSLFLSPDRAIQGVNASLLDMVTGGADTIPSDPRKVCAPVAAMISGVHAPKSAFYKDPEAAAPQEPVRTQAINLPHEPALSDVYQKGGVNSPSPIKNPAKPENISPKVADFKGSVKAPSDPIIKHVETPLLAAKMTPSSVPSWVANRKNLPPYNAVSGAADEKTAVKNAKKQIKDTAAREMIKTLVNNKKTQGIENAEVAKRFLWMTASAAANSLDGVIKTADRWTSPAGQIFVLCTLDASLIKQALETAYENEYKKLINMSTAEYMALKPNVIY